MNEIATDLNARRAMVPVLAKKLLDVPFTLYGRDTDKGIDCIGVMAIAATQAGFDCPNILIRKVGPHGNRWPPLLSAIHMDMERIKKSDIRVGDALWFRIPGAQIDHFAIVSDTNPIKMVHTNPLTLDHPAEQKLTDIMIDSGFYRSLGTWERWLSGAFRFAKLLDQEEETAECILLNQQEEVRTQS